MTVANIARKNGPFVSDGVQKVFAFGFRVLTAAEILVTQDDAIVNPAFFTVNGIGADTGSITLTTAAPLGDILWIFGDTTKQQPTSYPPNGAFPSVSHETGLDRPMMTLWEFFEVLERIPTFKQSSLLDIRRMELPQPEALKFPVWNATADGMTNADSTILTVTPLPGGGARVEAQASVSVPAIALAETLTAASLVPAGALLTGAGLNTTTEFGASNGLTGLSLGIVNAPDIYGRGLPVSTGSSNAGQWRSQRTSAASSALSLIIRAEGGTFDAVGVAIVTAVFEVWTFPASVP